MKAKPSNLTRLLADKVRHLDIDVIFDAPAAVAREFKAQFKLKSITGAFPSTIGLNPVSANAVGIPWVEVIKFFEKHDLFDAPPLG